MKLSSSLRMVNPVEKNNTNELSMKPGGLVQTEDITYHVDPDGYLLDNENYYLLDGKDNRIRLSLKQMEIVNLMMAKKKK